MNFIHLENSLSGILFGIIICSLIFLSSFDQYPSSFCSSRRSFGQTLPKGVLAPERSGGRSACALTFAAISESFRLHSTAAFFVHLA